MSSYSPSSSSKYDSSYVSESSGSESGLARDMCSVNYVVTVYVSSETSVTSSSVSVSDVGTTSMSRGSLYGVLIENEELHWYIGLILYFLSPKGN